jgi:hypothetical protein
MIHHQDSVFQRHGDSSILVVLLHAYMLRPKDFEAVATATNQEMPNADIFIPSLPLSLFSFADPNDIAQEVVKQIDELWKMRSDKDNDHKYQKIILAGHSLGALLARKVYIIACGENDDAPFESQLTKSPYSWAGQVERIILLAAMNRGWEVNHHLNVFRGIVWTIGIWLANALAMLTRRRPTVLAVHRGATFITQLRIQWLSMRHKHAQKLKSSGGTITVQLLGTIDDFVSPEDNMDLISGKDFVYLDVPFTGHSNIIQMNSTEAGRHRREKFILSLTAELNALRAASEQLEDLMPHATMEEIKDVVFVVHGIRDEAFWTKKIARAIKRRGRERSRVIQTQTSTYGYFPMLPFLLPSGRREKVEWLMDKYTEARALFPNAEVSYVGHSNGTYLLARALNDYKCCKFKYVIFAGSVVRTDYNWSQFLYSNPQRVKAVLNYVASGDWVVAFFPKAMEILGIQDIGSAGYDGFRAFQPDGDECEVRYIKGGHGAALNERNWEAIASFIVDGKMVSPPPEIYEKVRDSVDQALISNPSKVAPLLWLLLIAMLSFVARRIWSLHLSEGKRTTILLGFIWTLWKIVTRV